MTPTLTNGIHESSLGFLSPNGSNQIRSAKPVALYIYCLAVTAFAAAVATGFVVIVHWLIP